MSDETLSERLHKALAESMDEIERLKEENDQYREYVYATRSRLEDLTESLDYIARRYT